MGAEWTVPVEWIREVAGPRDGEMAAAPAWMRDRHVHTPIREGE